MRTSLLISLATEFLISGSALVGQTTIYPKPLFHPPAIERATAVPPISLSGIWEAPFGTPGKPGYRLLKVQFTQNGQSLKAAFVQTGTANDGVTAFKGTYSGMVVNGQFLRVLPTPGQPGQWVPGQMIINDADHVHFSSGWSMSRLTPLPSDVACDSQNTYGVKADYAFKRGYVSLHVGDKQSAVCWFHVSATQGNAQGQAMLALMLHDGSGVPQNYAAAFDWAQKSAAQNDPVGEGLLAEMYRKGEGMAPNLQLAKTWEDKQAAQTARGASPQQEPSSQALRPHTAQTSTANAPHQLTPAEAMGILIVGAMLADGGSTTNNSDSDGDMLRQHAQQQEEDDQHLVHDCDQAGGTTDWGVSGPTCH